MHTHTHTERERDKPNTGQSHDIFSKCITLSLELIINKVIHSLRAFLAHLKFFAKSHSCKSVWLLTFFMYGCIHWHISLTCSASHSSWQSLMGAALTTQSPNGSGRLSSWKNNRISYTFVIGILFSFKECHSHSMSSYFNQCSRTLPLPQVNNTHVQIGGLYILNSNGI